MGMRASPCFAGNVGSHHVHHTATRVPMTPTDRFAACALLGGNLDQSQRQGRASLYRLPAPAQAHPPHLTAKVDSKERVS